MSALSATLRTGSPALLAAALCALALGGCGLGAGPAPSAVKLLVTRDFGARVLAQSGAPKVAGQETVMSLLERNDAVSTRYGGGFVQSINGLAGGDEAGLPVDWFYYVNGVEAAKGAAATDVHAGDQIWWDRHDWSQAEDIPAVVGSFPEPFLNGFEGKRYPVRVECADTAAHACSIVAARLRAAGVPAALAATGSGGAPYALRVMVGPWASLKGEAGTPSIAGGPRVTGIYARFAPDGAALTLLDQDGRAMRTLTGGAGLIAATREQEDAPVWVVTGTDAQGVELAARDFDEATLAHHFAVALYAGASMPLPIGGA